MTNARPTPSCPLCAFSRTVRREVVSLIDVWDAYERVWGTRFTPEVRRRYGDDAQVTLHECRCCSLQWFDPALEGDARFYQELHRGIHYEPWRWEFSAASERIAGGSRVVEVGAGQGAFITSIVDRAASVEVLDKNPDAARHLRDLGVKVVGADVLDDARKRPGRADAVCAFQVLEHVADVAGFLAALKAIAAPGGLVLISVPNRNRYREALEPNDVPPHHLTRWAPQTMWRAAQLSGLEPLELLLEPPAEVGYCRLVRQEPVRDHLTPLVGQRAADVVARASARLRMPMWRYERRARSGRLTRGRDVGHTMMAVLRRPA